MMGLGCWLDDNDDVIDRGGSSDDDDDVDDVDDHDGNSDDDRDIDDRDIDSLDDDDDDDDADDHDGSSDDDVGDGGTVIPFRMSHAMNFTASRSTVFADDVRLPFVIAHSTL